MLAKWKRHLVTEQEDKVSPIRTVCFNDEEMNDLDYKELKQVATEDVSIGIDSRNKSIRSLFTVGQTAELLFEANRVIIQDPKTPVERSRELAWDAFVPEFYGTDYSKSYLDKLRSLYRRLGPYPMFQFLQISTSKLLKRMNAIGTYLSLPENKEMAAFWKRNRVPNRVSSP